MLVHALRRALCILALPLLFAVQAPGQGILPSNCLELNWNVAGPPSSEVAPNAPTTGPRRVSPASPPPGPGFGQGIITTQGGFNLPTGFPAPVLGDYLPGAAGEYFSELEYSSNVLLPGADLYFAPNSHMVGAGMFEESGGPKGFGGGFFPLASTVFIVDPSTDELIQGANHDLANVPMELIETLEDEAHIYGRDGSKDRFWEFLDTQGPTGEAEMRHADGTVVRLVDFPNTDGTVRSYRTLYILDPFDNKTLFEYAGDYQLNYIHYPNGITATFNYNPTWAGSGWSGIEVTYNGDGSDAKWAMVFEGADGFLNGRLARIYYPKTPYVPTPSAGNLFNTGSESDAYTVYEFEANGSDSYDLVTDVYQARATSITPTVALSNRVKTLNVVYDDEDDYRVSEVTLSLHGETTTFTYALHTSSDEVEYIYETSPLDTITTTKLDLQGRPVSIKVEAATDADGMPRANETAEPDEGPGGVNFSTWEWAEEPTFLEWTYEYGESCVCMRSPTKITDPSGRVTEFDYDDDTGLLVEIEKPDPSDPGSSTVIYTFDWENGFTEPNDYPGYVITEFSTPDGTWDDDITFASRKNSDHGKKPYIIETTSPDITLEEGSPQAIETALAFTGVNPTYPQTKLAWQVLVSVDMDGNDTNFAYDSTGLLDSRVTNYDEGGNTVTTEFTVDDWGRVEEVINNYGSSHANAITVDTTIMGNVKKTAVEVGSQDVDKEVFFDRWGNVAVIEQTNQDSSGGEPDHHGSAGETARSVVRNEFHYEGTRLIATYEDRRSLDRNASGTVADATDARMLLTGYSYRPDGMLDFATLPNGTTRHYVFDGYGTLYRVIDEDDSASASVSRGYFYYNESLELVAVFVGATDAPLWTSYDRNGAGYITGILEPELETAPTGYSGSLGGASHELTYDSMGRVTQRETYDGATLLAKSVFTYDELGRVRNRKDYALGAGLSGNDYHETSILYDGGKGTHISKVTRTGNRVVEYDYDSAGRIKEIRDDDGSNPNKRVYSYHGNTNFLSKIESKLYDDDTSVATLKSYVMEYGVDELGRVTEIRNTGLDEDDDGDGDQTALTHEFTYYSLGFTETYTDPMDKVTKFLPDALGRLVESVEVADTEDIVNSVVYTDWTSENDNRTLVERYDGRDRLTVTHFDYAYRPFLVQTPGADLENEPTLTDPYQKFSRLLKYDEASRVTNEYVAVAWDDMEDEFTGIETRYFYDGPGRLIVQETPNGHASPGASDWSTRDEYRRDALGRITDLIGYAGNIATPWPTHQIQFDDDSLGRTHEERYLWSPAFAGTNVIDITSTYNAPSNKTDLFRDGLTYSNGLDLTFTPDAIHRIAGIDWDGGAESDLAKYNHMGSRTSFRELIYGDSATGETDFDFDDYGRLGSILDETIVETEGPPVITEIAGFDYAYDAASNLIKEVYDKDSGAVGDRFEYDGFHRLLDGWVGVDSTTMNMGTINEETAVFDQRLTYTLDDAGNRDWVNIQNGPEEDPETEDYATQDSGSGEEAQGPSNRYQAVISKNLVYDYRGNLVYDERNSLAYEYDFKNRLSEVYSVSESFSASSGSSAGLLSSAHLYDPDAIYRAQAEIRRNTGGPEEILKNHGKPEWRWRLSAPLRTGDGKEEEEPKEDGGLKPAPAGPSVGEETETFEVTLTLIAVYVHDGFNRRVVRARLGEATYMSAYDGWREVEECVKSGNSTVPIKQFVWGERLDEQIAYREWDGEWNNYFVHNGGQDSVTRIVDEDGDVVEMKEFDPYGIESSYGTGTLNPYSWKGHRLDPETGLIYMRNRYYNPQLGRFMTHDPLGVWADGLNLGNGYAYAANNPPVYADPLGQFTRENHEQITRDGLADSGLSEKCVQTVVDGNLAMDKGHNFGDPLNHGDNNRIAATLERARGRLYQCRGFGNCSQLSEKLRLFGAALHAVQDLYAHSTYVEKSHPDRHKEAGNMPIWDMWPDMWPDPKDTTRNPNVPPGVMSGTWPLRDGAKPHHNDLAKDENTDKFPAGQVKNDAGVSNFEFAKSLATRHTSQLWNQFVSRLSPVQKWLLEECCKK